MKTSVVHYDEQNQQSIALFILDTLPSHKHGSLATADSHGTPWVVCLSLEVDENMTILWRSKKDTTHSQQLLERPGVSFCISSNEEGRGNFGFYGHATAREINDPAELQRILKSWQAKRPHSKPHSIDYLDGAPMRFYAATIQTAFVTDDRHHKTAVDLQVLRAAAKQRQT